jgi:arsenate reductase
MMSQKIRVLFLCTGNSCRSQMAEGLCRHLKGDQLEPCSAGIEKHGLNPLAVKAMQEIGVDISGHQSKLVEELEGEFDYVVTVCGHAHETCPVFPARTQLVHRGFEDPPQLAAEAANEEEAMKHYRRVRDEIRDYIVTLPKALTIYAQEREGINES